MPLSRGFLDMCRNSDRNAENSVGGDTGIGGPGCRFGTMMGKASDVGLRSGLRRAAEAVVCTGEGGVVATGEYFWGGGREGSAHCSSSSRNGLQK